MKQLKCDLCGSTDFLKEDGVFVCQYCKTKYTVEEARKMMIEGTVDVSGSTIKVDSGEDIANWYRLARRAKENGDYSEALKYYERILEKEPNNWEPYFYASICRTLQADNSNIGNAVGTFNDSLPDVFGLVLSIEDENEKKKALASVINESINLGSAVFKSMIDLRERACGSGAYTGQVRSWVFSGAAQSIQLMDTVATNIDFIKETYGDRVDIKEYESLPNEIRKTEIENYVKLAKILNSYESEQLAFVEKNIKALEGMIKQSDASYVSPKVKNAGCYLTTACVEQRGLPDDCDELTTLRLFRDGYMKAQPGGKEDILEYYEKAPKIVEIIGEQKNKSEIYDHIYNDVIVPCVKYIKNGENEAAYEKYRAMVKHLETEYLN